MRYEENEAPEAAAAYVEMTWLFDVRDLPEDAPTHVIVPDGTVSIAVIRLPGGPLVASFSGPSTAAYNVNLLPGAVYAGVRLRPGVAGSVLDCDIAPYLGAFGPDIQPRPPLLDQIQSKLPPSAAPDDMPDVLQAAALWIADRSKPIDPPVSDLAAAIVDTHGSVPIGELVGTAAAISERQLRRRFKRQCGLSPKALARLRRVRQACIELVSHDPANFAAAALQTGFADQSHMSRVFQDVFGTSASLVEQYLRQIQHVGVH